MDFTSIIITHFGMNEIRSEILRKSLLSLFPTIRKLPCEVIVVDNGENYEDSQWLLTLAHNNQISTYVRNARNMHFGFARTQGLRLSNGAFIAVCDNDIKYHNGWLEACLRVLKAYPKKKIYATPIYNVAHWLPKFWAKEVLSVKGEIYRLNSRAGSNCWVTRREDFEEIGEFLVHRVAGTKWTEEAIGKGFMAAVTPQILVDDMQFREGYNFKKAIPIKITLSNGKEVFFNVDEHRRENKRSHKYLEQRSFNPKSRIRFKRELREKR